jgi:hypothetical protein
MEKPRRIRICTAIRHSNILHSCWSYCFYRRRSRNVWIVLWTRSSRKYLRVLSRLYELHYATKDNRLCKPYRVGDQERWLLGCIDTRLYWRFCRNCVAAWSGCYTVATESPIQSQRLAYFVYILKMNGDHGGLNSIICLGTGSRIGHVASTLWMDNQVYNHDL